ncbi:hypothetical protein [Anaeromicrobium sediminis]|uniref:ACT domain-containing protein n=1 Tax=Anaeromicrobium sediminis TaxID=1478221 RepID=A0A267MC21_9FIRM|nr:hypothetical protein [Anaeromicrobium sediminis]PAB56363.1 hypothetical protein CCE28_20940 [Anaeromicrobium sediminis]
MNNEFSTNVFSYKIRIQFSFIVDDPTLSCILNTIANQDISITGCLQTKPLETDNNYNFNLVRLTVGSPDAETSRDLEGVKNTLNSFGIKFEEKPVIQVLQIISGIPGIISGLFRALWCNVTVNAFYIGEDNRYFIDVSDVCKALLILSETPTIQCPIKCSPSCKTN